MRDSGPQRDGRIGLGWIGRWAVGRGGRRRVRSEGGEEVRHRHRQRALAVWHACCAPTVIHTYPPRDVLPAPQLCTHARPICEPTVAARSRNLTWSVVVPFPRAPARLLRLLIRPALSPDSRRRCIPEPGAGRASVRHEDEVREAARGTRNKYCNFPAGGRAASIISGQFNIAVRSREGQVLRAVDMYLLI